VFVFVVVLSFDPNQPATPLQELSDSRAIEAASNCFIPSFLQNLCPAFQIMLDFQVVKK
jgi:hypothetical protein